MNSSKMFFFLAPRQCSKKGVEQWCSGKNSWLTEQEVRGSIPVLAATISEIGYLMLQSRDMAEISLLKQR